MAFNFDTGFDGLMFLVVDIGYKLEECAVLRNFTSIHTRQGRGKHGPDSIWIDWVCDCHCGCGIRYVVAVGEGLFAR